MSNKPKIKKVEAGFALEAKGKAILLSKSWAAGFQATWTPLEINFKKEETKKNSIWKIDLCYFIDTGWDASVAPPSAMVNIAGNLELKRRRVRKIRLKLDEDEIIKKEELGDFNALYGSVGIRGSLGMGGYLDADVFKLKCLVYDDENDEVELGIVAGAKGALILGEELPDFLVETFKLKVDFGGNVFLKTTVSMEKFKKIARNQRWIR